MLKYFCVFVSDILSLKFPASKNVLHPNSVAKSMNSYFLQRCLHAINFSVAKSVNSYFLQR